MDDDLKTRLEARLTAPTLPALDRAREFLAHYVHDADMDLVERMVRGVMKVNPRIVVDAVLAIEELIAVPPPPGALHEIVTYDGNQMLDDDTDEGAAAWLKDLVAQLRRWLGQHAPASREAAHDRPGER